VDGYQRDDGFRPDDGGVASRFQNGCLWLLGLAAFLIVALTLESEVGIPSDTTLRVACIVLCQYFIYKLRDDTEERWPRFAFWGALAVNLTILFSPLANRPASRGELMLFAAPDAIVVLGVITLTYRVTDAHQRAIRQQLIVGLILAVAIYATLFTVMVIDPHGGHSWGLYLSKRQ
jgi:hypothetical protein